MKNPDFHTQRLVQKFIDGKCSADELNSIREMDPELFKKQLEALNREEVEAAEATDISATKGSLYSKIERESGFDNTFYYTPRLRAAVLVFLLIGSLSWYYYKHERVEYAYATTQQAEQIKVSLEDGTAVWLNSYSQLKYPKHFKADKREVFLDGEGYFEVRKESGRPFIVHFDKSEVNVWGTAFNVKSFSNEPDKYVTLLTGIVRVRTGDSEWPMEPGEETHIDKTGEAEKYKADMAISLAWREKSFQFHRASLVEVAGAIRRWYGVEVQIPDKKLHQRKVTIRIRPGEKIYAVLNALTEAVNLKYRREGEGVVISE